MPPEPAPAPQAASAPPARGVDTAPDLAAAFDACRERTLALFEDLDDHDFREQIHPGYSPLGWHLGHIAYTEAHWLVRTCGARDLPRPELEPTFHVDGLPKSERGLIPPQEEVRAYARDVRRQMLDCLAGADLAAYGRHWRFVLQHECQHAETVALLRTCRDASRAGPVGGIVPAGAETVTWLPMAGGATRIGDDGPAALDNETPSFLKTVAPFEIAARPVTQAQFAAFMADHGYDRPELWCEAGWAWRQRHDIRAPLYWRDGDGAASVFGVSGHEADAFARWAGSVPGGSAGVRLPSEFEWEHACQAAGPDGFLGEVWQWTSSVFAPYPEFTPWPYAGYSQAYFDGEHRVLRGGSNVTRPWAMRASFRNWYTPDTRQLIAGFRLARDA